ncbi:Endoglucanase-5 [Colletotrichum higginsianum]|uniref:cellulase n=1 Tax=Colletotrichum higginsianum TaxID=80884 RepID=A0A4T0VHB7_9PEZI|nr:Endoglucanase-5 [Colletotrichum higginsianum]
MVVQSTNTGGDLGSNHFDIMMPGGGLGIFDGCTSEFGFQFPGARYGGVSSRSECSFLPAKLQNGCQWRFDWFMNADNPSLSFTQVQCPSELVARSGCRRSDDASFPAFQMPTNTKWEPPQPTETAGPHEQCDSTAWDVQKKVWHQSHGVVVVVEFKSIFDDDDDDDDNDKRKPAGLHYGDFSSDLNQQPHILHIQLRISHIHDKVRPGGGDGIRLGSVQRQLLAHAFSMRRWCGLRVVEPVLLAVPAYWTMRWTRIQPSQ